MEQNILRVEKREGKRELLGPDNFVVTDANVVGAISNFTQFSGSRHHKAGAPRGLQFRHPMEAPGAALQGKPSGKTAESTLFVTWGWIPTTQSCAKMVDEKH